MLRAGFLRCRGPQSLLMRFAVTLQSPPPSLMSETGQQVSTMSVTDGAIARPGMLSSWVRLIRPQQWIKNCFVLAPLLFSGKALESTAQLRSILAFLVFCGLASSVYIFNDVIDRAADRAHPVKRARPIASGEVGVGPALVVAALALAASVTSAFLVSPALGGIAVSYLALNVLYSVWLKHVVIVDVFAVSAFFILRLLAGAAAVDVRPSVWLILCGGLLSLYLGFAKRRHELVLLGVPSAGDHRAVLAQYSTQFLDQLSVVLLSVTIVSYIMYTLESDTAQLVGGEALSYSTVFVLYGVLRYLHLVHRQADGNPTDTLLTDRGLLAAVVLWVIYCGLVLYRPF
jgi:4-hydroxybenzoate polyprenyltransferase